MGGHACLRCLFSKSVAPPRILRRQFHFSSGLRQASNLPKTSNKSSKDARKKEVTPTRTAAEKFPAYSEEDKKKLTTHLKYTPAQLTAIEAGEAAIDPQDLADQASLRGDPFAFEYLDDFATINPVIDHPVRAPKENHDPNMRYKTEDELAGDFVKFIEEMPEDGNVSRLDIMKFTDNLRLTVGKEEAERNPISSLAPAIPKGLEALQQKGVARPGHIEIDPGTKRLMRQTGFSLEEIRRFRVKNLVVHRVVNQTKMGKIQSVYYLTVAGNGKGLLGIGEGKSTEAEEGRRQSQFAAIRNVQPIPLYEERTIYGNVKVKMGAVELELMSRPPGMCNQEQDIAPR